MGLCFVHWYSQSMRNRFASAVITLLFFVFKAIVMESLSYLLLRFSFLNWDHLTIAGSG